MWKEEEDERAPVLWLAGVLDVFCYDLSLEQFPQRSIFSWLIARAPPPHPPKIKDVPSQGTGTSSFHRRQRSGIRSYSAQINFKNERAREREYLVAECYSLVQGSTERGWSPGIRDRAPAKRSFSMSYWQVMI